jgi:hypothetical protein
LATGAFLSGVEVRAASMTLGITTIAASSSVTSPATINPAYFLILCLRLSFEILERSEQVKVGTGEITFERRDNNSAAPYVQEKS